MVVRWVISLKASAGGETMQRTAPRLTVFRRSGERFVPTEVAVGRSDAAYVEITGGLLPGDRVVVSGAGKLRYAFDSPELPEG